MRYGGQYWRINHPRAAARKGRAAVARVSSIAAEAQASAAEVSGGSRMDHGWTTDEQRMSNGWATDAALASAARQSNSVLSRVGAEHENYQLTLSAMSANDEVALEEQIRAAALADAAYQLLLETPPANTLARDGLLLDAAGVILSVPSSTALRTRILAHCHDDVTGAHFGRDKTLAAVQQRFRWAGLTTSVESYVATCDACQRNKPSQQLTPGALMPLPLPAAVNDEWTNDMVTGLPKTRRGFDAI